MPEPLLPTSELEADAAAWLRSHASEVGRPNVPGSTEANEGFASSLAEAFGGIVLDAVGAIHPSRNESHVARAPDLGDAYTALLSAKGYTDRPIQREYAQRVLAAFEEGRPLAIEAGTGTGKTDGYLVAGFEHVAGGSGRRLLVATPTVTLRDQTRESADRVAGLDRYSHLRTATYKARSSYLCGTKVGRALADAASGSDLAAVVAVFGAVHHAEQYGGEVCPAGPDGLGCAAPCGLTCPASRARDHALAADAVVMTHAALARLSHPELTGVGGRSKLEGGGFVYVIDEADQFPGSVRLALRRSVVLSSLRTLAGRLEAAGSEFAADAEKLRASTDALDGMADPAVFPRRRWTALAQVRHVERALGSLKLVLDRMQGRLAEWGGAPTEETAREDAPAAGSQVRERASAMVTRMLRPLVQDLQAILEHQRTHEWLHTVDRRETDSPGRGVLGFHREPFLLSALPGGPLPYATAVVLTSATLTHDPTANEPGPFVHDIGVPGVIQVETMRAAYDIREHVAAAIVDLQPRYDHSWGPREREDWLWAVEKAVTDVTQQFGGRTLVLLTSRRDMVDLNEQMRPSLDHEGYMIDTQDTPDAIEWFKSDADAGVLLGVRRVWTGIDIRGRALSAVVVPRLPFPPPDAAEVWQVSEHEWERRPDLFGPAVALQMRQGMGRIVREESDQGVFVCLDGRLGDEHWKSIRSAIHPSFDSVLPDELGEWTRRHAKRFGLTPEVKGTKG